MDTKSPVHRRGHDIQDSVGFQDKKEQNGTRGPLKGLRVLELGQIAAGPFAGSLLADLGADVVKIERPDGGDGMRDWPPLTEAKNGTAYSENFASLNRNKRSMVLDLKSPQDNVILKDLVTVSDVFLENFRPGVLPRLGLAYDDLKLLNEALIYCSISGYGQIGPYAEKGAFDVTVQAMAGIMSVTGQDDGPPVKCGVPIGDFCAGLYAAYCVVSLLNQVRDTGRGAFIDCSMIGSLIGISALQTSEFFGTGKPPVRLGSAHPRNAPYQAFQASDSDFVIAAGNNRLWGKVCDAVGLSNLTVDPRFETQALRAANQNKLVQILAPEFEKKTAREWLIEMDRRGVPCAPINTYGDMLADQHVSEMGILHSLMLSNGVETKTTGFPIKMSCFDYAVVRPPPELGEHNTEIIEDWLNNDSVGEKETP
jgi:succinate--hydroxymethylglutarate CoA-transferase